MTSEGIDLFVDYDNDEDLKRMLMDEGQLELSEYG